MVVRKKQPRNLVDQGASTRPDKAALPTVHMSSYVRSVVSPPQKEKKVLTEKNNQLWISVETSNNED